MSSNDFIFRKTKENVFVRRCFGIEAASSLMEEQCDGFTHLTNTALVRITPSPTRESLEEKVREAWISLRHFMPSIACKTFRFPAPDDSFAFRYTVPESLEDVTAWANETIFFSSDAKPLYEKHRELKDGRWWRCSDDHYVVELHVSPSENGWQFSMIFSHNSIDGRNSFAVVDHFLRLLSDVFENKKKSAAELKWGEEVSRLPPPGPFAVALTETGNPPNLPSSSTPDTTSVPTGPENATSIQKEGSAPPVGPIPWLYAPLETDRKGDVSRIVKLSSETTANIHAAAKLHGRTITQVITALSMLAHTEVSLNVAGKAGNERYSQVSGAFSQATHYLVAFNFINHRHKFPGGYDSFESSTSAPLCSIDGVPLLLPIEPLRKSFNTDDGNRSALRVINEHVFWNELVEEVSKGWASTDLSLRGYFERQVELQAGVSSFDPTQMFHIPALIVSSIGDLGRLGLLDAYLPSSTKKAVIIEDVICGIRIRVPPLTNLIYQYDGRISCHFMSAGEYTTGESLKLVTDSFEEWIAALF